MGGVVAVMSTMRLGAVTVALDGVCTTAVEGRRLTGVSRGSEFLTIAPTRLLAEDPSTEEEGGGGGGVGTEEGDCIFLCLGLGPRTAELSDCLRFVSFSLRWALI